MPLYSKLRPISLKKFVFHFESFFKKKFILPKDNFKIITKLPQRCERLLQSYSEIIFLFKILKKCLKYIIFYSIMLWKTIFGTKLKWMFGVTFLHEMYNIKLLIFIFQISPKKCVINDWNFSASPFVSVCLYVVKTDGCGAEDPFPRDISKIPHCAIPILLTRTYRDTPHAMSQRNTRRIPRSPRCPHRHGHRGMQGRKSIMNPRRI